MTEKKYRSVLLLNRKRDGVGICLESLDESEVIYFSKKMMQRDTFKSEPRKRSILPRGAPLPPLSYD